MHDQCILVSEHEPLGAQSPLLEEFLCRREKALSLPFKLDAQHHYDICSPDPLIHLIINFHPSGRVEWNESRRPDKPYTCSQFRKAIYIRTGNPAVKDISNNCNFKSLDPTLPFFHGHRIKKRLRRMLIDTVSGIYH